MTAGTEPAMTAEEWLGGLNRGVLHRVSPHSVFKLQLTLFTSPVSKVCLDRKYSMHKRLCQGGISQTELVL